MSTAHTAAISHAILSRASQPAADTGSTSFIRSLDSISFQTTCSKGSILFCEGDRPQGVVVVSRGAVKLTMTSPDGLTLIIRTASAGEILESVRLFDLYTGKQIPSDKKSMAFALVFRAADRNLRDEEVDAWQRQIVQKLEQEVGAQLRA